MLQITTQRTTTPKAKPDESNLGFGVHYTDHMLIIDHDEEQGWHDARIVPYQPLELDPAAMVASLFLYKNLYSFIIALDSHNARCFSAERVTNPLRFGIICSYELLKGVSAYQKNHQLCAVCRAAADVSACTGACGDADSDK